MKNQTIKLEGEKFDQYRQCRKSGMNEHDSIKSALGITADNFVSFATGTASRPEDGLWVKFFMVEE